MSFVNRAALAAACVSLALFASGCKEIQDIGEEMGWVAPSETTAEATSVAPSLESHWVPADTSVEGASQAQWSSRWGQWTARFPANESPYLDPDGSRCAQHQEGPVWFLAGTDGNFDAVRTCSIPAGKHVFVPLISWVVARGLQGTTMSCAEKKAEATRYADHVTSGLVLLDGRPVGELKRLRVASGSCFELNNSPAGATDGYWLMLKPLPPGKHQLAIAAAYRDGPKQMLQNFRYELAVEGEAGGTNEAAEAAQ